MGIIMGADTATNTQPAASPGRWQQQMQRLNDMMCHIIKNI